MVEQTLQQTQQLRQEQILAPQQLQSLELLQAPLLELQAKISEELAQNPVLELEQEEPESPEETQDVLPDENFDEDENPSLSDISDKAEFDEEKLAEIMQIAESWQYSLPTPPSVPHTEEDEEKRRHFFDSITEEPSLQMQLLEQLRLSNCPEEMKPLAELIIGSIDERGYLRSNLRDLATVGMVSLEEMEKALKFVQTFEPPGIGARDLKECLLLQLKAKGKQNSLLAKLISEHIDEIGANKIPLVAKKMGLSIEKVENLVAEIRKLNPFPGSIISSDIPVFYVPEIVVEKKDDKYVVSVKNEQIPRLRISEKYLEMLEDPSLPKEAREYLKNKILQGRNVMRSLDQRRETIQRIAEVIVDEQHDFFEKGIEFLKPLTMQQVADKLGLHETTVSRAVSSKFMETPIGVFEMKYFFTGGFQAENGAELSNKSVMKKINDLIQNENPEAPLADQEIAEILKKEGIPIARRTVAKYREELGIPPSRIRKEY